MRVQMTQPLLDHSTKRPRTRRGMQAPLATFQYIVFRAVQRLGRHAAYGMAVEDYITSHLPDLAKKIDAAQIYITAKRLKKLGYLDAHDGQPSNQSRHTVTFYSVTAQGVRAADEAAAFYAAIHKLEKGDRTSQQPASPMPAPSAPKRTRRARSAS